MKTNTLNCRDTKDGGFTHGPYHRNPDETAKKKEQ